MLNNTMYDILQLIADIHSVVFHIEDPCYGYEILDPAKTPERQQKNFVIVGMTVTEVIVFDVAFKK